MPKLWSQCMILAVVVSLLVPFCLRRSLHAADPPATPDDFDLLTSSVLLQRDAVTGHRDANAARLRYDFYRETCPGAEDIVRKSMARIHSQHPDVSAALLRLLFHDCFIQGCDASVFLEETRANQSHPVERHAVPNRTLKGFEKIDSMKEELESRCPGVVSCADILVLAAREGIVLSGGPFYPILTGRRDSITSHYQEAIAEIPRPDDNIAQMLSLFHLRGFTDRETVSLLGAHSIGGISCEFIRGRLYNFLGTGQPDPSIAFDFLTEMRIRCDDGNNGTDGGDISSMKVESVEKPSSSLTHQEEISISILSAGGFDSHYYRSLLTGRGLLHSDQQLMADERTARLVRAYASDDGIAFRMDFARAMMKMSSLGVLIGSEGQVRTNCASGDIFVRNDN